MLLSVPRPPNSVGTHFRWFDELTIKKHTLTRNKMESLFGCPLPSALTAILDQPCVMESGSIISIALQLEQAAPTFTGTGSDDIKAVTAWNTQIAANDATAIRIIPVNNFTVAPGEAITSGGNDNTYYRGLPKLLHGGYSTASAVLEGYTPATAKAARAFTKFSKVPSGIRTKLRAFFLTDANYIGHMDDFNGLPVWNWFVSDLNKAGEFKETDNYNLQFVMEYGWSENLNWSKATFNVGALVNPAS